MRTLPPTYVRAIGDVARTSRALVQSAEWHGKQDAPRADDGDAYVASFKVSRNVARAHIDALQDALHKLRHLIDTEA